MVYNFNGLMLQARLLDGKPMFKGDDITKALGFKNSSRTIKGICEPHQYRSVYLGGQQGGRASLMVTFGGVCRLAMRSEKEEAIEYQNWVCDEVIPSVYETGGYISPTATPVQAIALSDKLAQIISPTKRPWTLHFSKEWQKEACRLTKVTWKHPRMGQFINQVVYDFFDKEAISKIRELNLNGQEEHTAHHQYLTEKFDAVAYQQHLRDIEGYMMASPDLEFFWRLMSFRFKKTFQMSLFD